jgi:N-acetylmuramoyl-L-alanine amidase
MAVFLDPGHNAVNDASINQKVPTVGEAQAVQHVGTRLSPFTWDVVQQISGSLDQLVSRNCRGITTAPLDPVDQRALANAMHRRDRQHPRRRWPRVRQRIP